MRLTLLTALGGALILAGCEAENPAIENQGAETNISDNESVEIPPVQPTIAPTNELGPEDAGAPPPEDVRPGPLPVRFRGLWAIESKDCTAKSAFTRIHIEPTEILYYEGRSEVTGATGGRDRITIQGTHHAEGMTEPLSQTLSLSTDGQVLTFQRAGDRFIYRRCNGAPAAPAAPGA
mgnify:CR=1 FL=1